MNKLFLQEVLQMKKISVPWFAGSVAAWDMLFDIPIPRVIRDVCYKKEVTPLETAIGFVTVGIIFGAVLALFNGILICSWINRYVAAGIFAVAATFLCEFKDSARGLRLLISAVSRKIGGEDWCDCVLEASAFDHSFEKTSGSMPALLIILLELLCFAALGYTRNAFWCVAVFAGACTIQMLFATLPRTLGQEPFLCIPSEKRLSMWYLPIAAACVLIFFYPAAGVVAAALVGGLGQMIHKDFILTSTPVTADVITLCGKMTELILLFCGLLFVL